MCNLKPKLQAHNRAFVLTEDYKQQKAEVTDKVLQDPKLVEFHLMMASSAFKSNSGFYLPNPMTYFSAEATDLEQFFARIEDTTEIVRELHQVASKAIKKDGDQLSLWQNLARTSNLAIFMRLLHFTLCSCPVRLNEVSAPWYKSLQKTQTARVFTLQYSPLEEQQFAARGVYKHLLYHVTSEANLYSILRNGIQTSVQEGVQLSSQFNVHFNGDVPKTCNGAYLIFEARTNATGHQLASCYFPRHDIRLRAVMWIAGNNMAVTSMVGANVMNDLANQGVVAK